MNLTTNHQTVPVISESIESASVIPNDSISTPIPTQPSLVITTDTWDATKLSTGDINSMENAPHTMSLKYHERLAVIEKAVTQQINMNMSGSIIAAVIYAN